MLRGAALVQWAASHKYILKCGIGIKSMSSIQEKDFMVALNLGDGWNFHLLQTSFASLSLYPLLGGQIKVVKLLLNILWVKKSMSWEIFGGRFILRLWTRFRLISSEISILWFELASRYLLEFSDRNMHFLWQLGNSQKFEGVERSNL